MKVGDIMKFTKAEIMIVNFDVKDVITTSSVECQDPSGMGFE